MDTLHFQKFTCSGDTFKTIRACMKEAEWQPGNPRGFGQLGEDANVITGALYSERAFTLKRVFDAQTREEKDETVLRLTRARFILDQRMGTIAFHERKDMKAITEALDGLPGVVFSLADFKLDLHGIYAEITKNYGDHKVKKISLADYMDKADNLIADVGFKVEDPRNQGRAIDRFKRQLKALAMEITLKTGKVKLAISARGAVSFSEVVPTELREYVLSLLPRFDDVGESAEPQMRYGIGKTADDMVVDKMVAQNILKHSKDKGAREIAQAVIDAVDNKLFSLADKITHAAVRSLRQTAKKIGGITISTGGKSVKIG